MTKFVKSVFISLVCFLLVGCSDYLSSRNEQDNSNHSAVQTSNCTFKDIKSEDDCSVIEKLFLISDIKKNLNILSKPSFSENEYRYEIALTTVDMIVDLVNRYGADLNEFDGLYLDAGVEGKISIYNFSLGSLSTSSSDFPIIVWKTASSRKAQKWDWNENISSIHELDTVHALYLVLSSSKLSGSEYISTAHTLQIHDDTINFSYSAFEGHPCLSVYNGFFSYDEQKETLVCKFLDYTTNAGIGKVEAYEDNTYPNPNYIKITCIDAETRCFSLKFNGNAFCAE